MNTLKLIKITFVTLLTFANVSAFAQKRGGTDGGGGGAMVRYDRKGTVLDAELIDLWEARNLVRKWEKVTPYRPEIPYGNEPVQVQIDRAMAKLRAIDPLFAERVANDLAFVQDHANWNELPEQITLPLPKDAKLNYEASDKVPKGMLFFDEELDKLSIKPEIFSKLMNNTNIAAAYTHEAIYKTLRDLEIVHGDSTEVRKINACLYATDDCFGLVYAKLQPISGAQVYSCASDSTKALLVLERSKIFQAGWQFYRATMQLHQLGSAHYPVPVTGHFNLSFNEERAEVSGGFPNFSNQMFEIYLPITPKFDSPQEHSIVQASPQGTPIAFGTTKDGRLHELTLQAGGHIVWNGVEIPEQTFTCTRLK